MRLGIGPVCRAKHAPQPDLFERRAAGEHARYDVVKLSELGARRGGSVVWIRDRDEDGCISVTNDAEHVVRELAARYPGARIIYRDSMGNWDELAHDGNGRFIGYLPAREMAPEAAA